MDLRDYHRYSQQISLIDIDKSKLDHSNVIIDQQEQGNQY